MRMIADHFGKYYHRMCSMHLLTDCDVSDKKVQWVYRNHKRKVLPRIHKDLRSRTMDDFELMRQRIRDGEASGR